MNAQEKLALMEASVEKYMHLKPGVYGIVGSDDDGLNQVIHVIACTHCRQKICIFARAGSLLDKAYCHACAAAIAHLIKSE